MAIQWGIASTGGTYGYIQNYEANNTIQIAEARDEDGEVAAIHKYDEKIECSFEYILDGAAPGAGDEITVTDGKIVLTSVQIIEANADFKRLRCSGTRYVTNALPA